MSYDPVMPDIPEWRAQYGVINLVRPIKSLLGYFEAEPKLLLEDPAQFPEIMRYLDRRPDTFLIRGSYWTGKNPLLNVILDTRENGVPTTRFEANQHSLRFRGEIDLANGSRKSERVPLTQKDFTEKNDMGYVLKGNDRKELDNAFPVHHSYQAGYKALQKKARKAKDPNVRFLCQDVRFQEMVSKSGYISARNNYGFGVHKIVDGVPFIMVFEPCEDYVPTINSEFNAITNSPDPYNPHCIAHFMEYEYECKAIHGALPASLRNKEKLAAFVREALYEIRRDIKRHVTGLTNNNRSKAEIANAQLSEFYGFNPAEISRALTSAKDFDKAADAMSYACKTATEIGVVTGMGIKEVIDTSGRFITEVARGLDRIRNENVLGNLIPEGMLATAPPKIEL